MLALNFNGDAEAFKTLVSQLGLKGVWQEPNATTLRFRLERGGVINFFSSTGTVQCQGKPPVVERIEKALVANGVASSGNGVVAQDAGRREVFVVYGHDKDAKTQLESMLRRWELEPLIFDQLPSKGKTIIEKLEEYMGKVDYGIVLATPDDVGFRKDHEDERAFRARQNVVLELGILLSRLGREKVAILIKDQTTMEKPSDIDGLLYLGFKEDVSEVRTSLAREMAEQGYAIDIKRL